MSDFDEKMIQRLKRLEQEVERLQRWERPTGTGGVTDHGALTGLADNDHPQYLLTTGKAADSDKLDGNDSTYFSPTTHNHTGVYLPIAGKAADSDKLDGVDITAFKGLNSLTDPNADRVLFWDDSVGMLKWLSLGTGLAITGTEIKPSQPQFYPLTTVLTSTSWDGDARSTTAKALIDLSVVFGVPAGVKAVSVIAAVRDSASATGEYYMCLSPVNTAGVGPKIACSGLANDKFSYNSFIVPCDGNGDIYYQIAASGTDTFDAYLQIQGYWL